MNTAPLLVELFVEELPPKALQKLGDAFASVLRDQLVALELADASAQLTAYASPRRLAAHIGNVLDQAPDKAVSQKLMPVAVGLGSDGLPTPALLKKLAALGADASAVAGLKRVHDGKAELLFYESQARGATLAQGLQKALDEAIARLPIPKVMRYQLQDGWSSVNFVRPAHGLVALHGSAVVPVTVLGLAVGNSTHGHRFEAAVDPVVIHDADSYAAQLAEQGAVIASFAERRAEIRRQLDQASPAERKAFRQQLRQQIEALTPAQRQALLSSSLVAGVYEKVVDRESAYEKLKGRAAEAGTQAGNAAGGGNGKVAAGTPQIRVADCQTDPQAGQRALEGAVEAAAAAASRASSLAKSRVLVVAISSPSALNRSSCNRFCSSVMNWKPSDSRKLRLISSILSSIAVIFCSSARYLSPRPTASSSRSYPRLLASRWDASWSAIRRVSSFSLARAVFFRISSSRPALTFSPSRISFSRESSDFCAPVSTDLRCNSSICWLNSTSFRADSVRSPGMASCARSEAAFSLSPSSIFVASSS